MDDLDRRFDADHDGHLSGMESIGKYDFVEHHVIGSDGLDSYEPRRSWRGSGGKHKTDYVGVMKCILFTAGIWAVVILLAWITN